MPGLRRVRPVPVAGVRMAGRPCVPWPDLRPRRASPQLGPERLPTPLRTMPTDLPQDIAAFLERYRDAFNALDGRLIADLYAQPSGIAQAGTYTHWPSRRLVRENMDALCALYRDKGYAQATFQVRGFLPQGSHSAIADLLWRIDRRGREQPWCFGTTYNLLRTEQGWQVLLCTAYEEDSVLRTRA